MPRRLGSAMSFSFGFSGDDIDAENDKINDDGHGSPAVNSTAPSRSAFPVPGKPQLPATKHDLQDLLSQLPSRIAFSTLSVSLDSGTSVSLPRRELWDVRLQLMAEDEDDELPTSSGGHQHNTNGSGTREEHHEPKEKEGLGNHDVKTGVYEGGFKSWESSVDLVKVLAAEGMNALPQSSLRVVEVSLSTPS